MPGVALLEHVPQKLIDFFYKDMLQFFELARFTGTSIHTSKLLSQGA
jgi:hypothetical protein